MRRRRKPRRKPPKTVVVTAVVGVLIALILVISAVMIYTERRQGPHQAGQPAPSSERTRVVSTTRIAAEELLVLGCLYELGIPRENVGTKGRTVHVRVTKPPSQSRIKKAFAPLEELEGVSVRMEHPGLLVITMNGHTWDVIFEGAAPRSKTRARVAIIVDDIGQEMAPVRRLAAIDADLTFSVLPNLPYTQDAARYLHRRGREILLHQPMEGKNGVNPGPGAIYASTDPAEAASILEDSISQVPYAVGVNNHMGSAVTRIRPTMDALFDVLGKRRLFFVDSLTTNESVCHQAAAEAGIPFASRDVFLDNVQDDAYIAGQIKKLEEEALVKGSAIGICHPHEATVRTLEREVPRLVEEGIEVVRVSVLAESPNGWAGEKAPVRHGAASW